MLMGNELVIQHGRRDVNSEGLILGQWKKSQLLLSGDFMLIKASVKSVLYSIPAVMNWL